ncbi:MAG: hypothetical protein ABIO46_01990 [Chitinophagales bacterium]
MPQTLQYIPILLLAFILSYGGSGMAQPTLKPSIGLTSIPNDTDPACPIPLAIDPANFFVERKNVATDMFSALAIQVPVLLDVPCNERWETFALAPNPSFLISPNGTIFKKQGWFDNGLYAASNAIDSLLENFPTAITEVKNDFKVINDPSSSVVQFVFSEKFSFNNFVDTYEIIPAEINQ